MDDTSNQSNPETVAAVDGDARHRLADARVLIVGVGGLGSPAARQLAAAGVGTLILADPDVVDLSNLHRQLLHGTSGIGTPKVLSAARRLAALYPATRIEPVPERVTAANVSRLFGMADFVIDGTDGVMSKFLVNDGAVLLQRGFSHAGVLGFHGQTMTVVPQRSACVRCVFPEPPPADAIPSCQEAGIIGAVAGTIGAVQATEAIRYLLGRTPLLADRMLTFDARAWHWRAVPIRRNPQCPACGERPTITALAESRQE